MDAKTETLKKADATLTAVLETLEVMEEGAEHEMEVLERRRQWADSTGIPYKLDQIESVQFFLDMLNDTIVDVAALQEDVGDALGLTPQ